MPDLNEQFELAQRSLGHEPQRQGGCRQAAAQRSLGHEPQRQQVREDRHGRHFRIAQRSLGHEPQRQSNPGRPKPAAASPLNEVWGMNPRDRYSEGFPA